MSLNKETKTNFVNYLNSFHSHIIYKIYVHVHICLTTYNHVSFFLSLSLYIYIYIYIYFYTSLKLHINHNDAKYTKKTFAPQRGQRVNACIATS